MNSIKNIIIIWTKRLDLQRGGVHRIIYLLSENLPKYGYDVQYIYTEDGYNTFFHYSVNGEDQRVMRDEMRQYLIDCHCDLLVGQDGIFSHQLSELVNEWSIPGMRYITEYHATIKHFENVFSSNYWIWLAFLKETPLFTRVSALCHYLLHQMLIGRTRSKLLTNFLVNYKIADAILFLSQYEILELQKLIGADLSRCKVINNPLSWENIEDSSIFEKKKKEVLIVSRLYNPEKRIDRALKIWKILEQRGYTDWTLRIVGSGVNEDYLKRLARKLKLQHVVFEGRQDAYPYYISASLFMMTSAAEGWGLTLTESLQMGVVPIAFDSYPALKDIITDGYDGCIIEDDNLIAYADCMEHLMTYPEERNNIARNGLESCKRFTIDNIVGQWVNLIKKL